MRIFSAVLLGSLVAVLGCSGRAYDTSTPAAPPSPHGYVKTSSVSEEAAGAVFEGNASGPACEQQGVDEAGDADEAGTDEAVVPSAGPSGAGVGGGP